MFYAWFAASLVLNLRVCTTAMIVKVYDEGTTVQVIKEKTRTTIPIQRKILMTQQKQLEKAEREN